MQSSDYEDNYSDFEPNESENNSGDNSDGSSVLDFDWVMIIFCPFISINPFIFFVVSANNPNNYHNNPSAS